MNEEEYVENFLQSNQKEYEPSDEDKKIYSLLSSKEGELFMEWLRKRTIERQLGYGQSDGVQTAILTARELGRHDVYHELKRLIFRISSYVNRK